MSVSLALPSLGLILTAVVGVGLAATTTESKGPYRFAVPMDEGCDSEDECYCEATVDPEVDLNSTGCIQVQEVGAPGDPSEPGCCEDFSCERIDCLMGSKTYHFILAGAPCDCTNATVTLSGADSGAVNVTQTAFSENLEIGGFSLECYDGEGGEPGSGPDEAETLMEAVCTAPHTNWLGAVTFYYVCANCGYDPH